MLRGRYFTLFRGFICSSTAPSTCPLVKEVKPKSTWRDFESDYDDDSGAVDSKMPSPDGGDPVPVRRVSLAWREPRGRCLRF
jgi:hypothetical protein